MVLEKVRLMSPAFVRAIQINMQDLVGLSNTVAMDFGRALFGPLGGTLFAFMVAFSCFGALNGMFHSPITYCYSFRPFRLVFHVLSTCICSRPGKIPTRRIWEATLKSSDTIKRRSATICYHNCVHYDWWRI